MIFRRWKLGQEFSDSYKTMIIEGGTAGIGAVFRLLAEPNTHPVVLHCTAGKDRTGVIIALLLLSLGVPEETVLADYSLSNLYAHQFIREQEPNIQRGWWLGMRVEHFYPLFSAHPDVLRSALAYIKTEYGSAKGYLTGKAGVEERHLEQLKENLLVEP